MSAGISRTTGLWLLLGIVFMDILSVGLVIPLIPFFAVGLGADAQMIGLLGSFYGMLQLFGSTLVGRLSDSFGRKMVLSLSIIGASISYFGMTQATTLGYLFLSRIPVGVFKHTMLISNTIVSDLSTHHDRAKFLGLVSTAASLGYIIGPALGGLLSELFSNSFPVYIACILYGFDLFVVVFIMVEPTSVVVEDDEDSEPTMAYCTYCDYKLLVKKVVSSSTLLYLLAVQFVASLASLTFNSTFSQFAFLQYNLNATTNGYLVAYQSVLEVLVQGFIIGKLTKIINEGNLVKYSLMLLSFSCVLLGAISEMWILLLALMPTILCLGIQSTCITSVITKEVSGASLGTVLGLSGSLSSICRIISPFIGGVIIEHYGMMGGMLLVSLMSAIMVLILGYYPAYTGHKIQDTKKMEENNEKENTVI